MAILKEENEILIQKCAMHYLSPDGDTYNGIFYITNFHIYFETNFKIKTSSVNSYEETMKFSIDEIQKAQKFTHFLIFKRLRIDLKNGAVMVFDRGILSVDRLVNTIMALINK